MSLNTSLDEVLNQIVAKTEYKLRLLVTKFTFVECAHSGLIAQLCIYIYILLMTEILHHLGCKKPCKQWDKLPTLNWLAGFQPTAIGGGFKISFIFTPTRANNPISQAYLSNDTFSGDMWFISTLEIFLSRSVESFGYIRP